MLRLAQCRGAGRGCIRVDDHEPDSSHGLTREPERDRGGYPKRSSRLYNDKNLTCADCGQEFVFTASEQDFYAQRGFTEPRRCASCRASRKAARGSSGAGYGSGSDYGASGGYSAGGSYGAGGSYSAGGYGGNGGNGGGYAGARDRGSREMFTATCSNCGNEARVPFRPTSGKPVYCSDCFRTMRG
ncbi:MAG: zinc-ribbon domain containing protein [Chloroflexi bacterium]|nr:zinc-ribbon domain containing protein [Chloroflexota bacterium]